MSTNDSINPPVFYASSGFIIAMVAITALFPEQSNAFFQNLQAGIVENASWFYVLAVAVILLSVVYFGFSRFGCIRLGPDHSRPEYGNISWFAMLFSAGMGIGIMFFGVAEPLLHFVAPPAGEPQTVDAAREAMQLSFFHWGLHAWGTFAIVALILAYFSYRTGMPLTLRSALYPLIGERISGPAGHTIDIFAILGTVFGVATSMGFGVLQINAGLAHLLGVPESSMVQSIIIVFVTAMALISVLSGLDKGIKFLSQLNMMLALALLGLVLVTGPTVYLIQSFVQNIGVYLSGIVGKTFNLYAYQPTDWIGGWTILYWGWWISWSPFVGMFIARISRGRTIREFCFGVLFVPAGFTMLWMSFFGNSAIDLVLNQGFQELAQVVQQNNSLAIFQFFEYRPFSQLLSGLAVVMVIVFFVTSADSGALVINMLASGGNENTPVWQRVYWTVLIGLVALVLMFAGGLSALQTAAIASALPFTFVIMLSIVGLRKALSTEILKRDLIVAHSTSFPMISSNADTETLWHERLDKITNLPSKEDIESFLANTVKCAFTDVAEAMRLKDIHAEILQSDGKIVFDVLHGDEIDFQYAVETRPLVPPSFILRDHDPIDEIKYFQAEVFLTEGGQGYDIAGYSREQIINDLLDQYEKHIHFLSLLR